MYGNVICDKDTNLNEKFICVAFYSVLKSECIYFAEAVFN